MNIEIRGLDELQRKLGAAVAARTLEPGMQRCVLWVQNVMANYPPERKNSRYIRGYGMEGGPRTSERLKEKWTTRVEVTAGGGVQGRVGNNVSYGPFVQSRRFQAWMHQGRWQTDEDVMESELTKRRLTEFLQDEIDAALGG